ncbi:uncharacterized protein LOC129757650 [Uranotaenia lowii]|uniref:uncharacterized protein LOC129757650 n=1 Tax=Uranotaenia lowii TaxID=190385 RepID=UPI00247A24BF|nr:uncharacterized protein LOC129757650 [Uranotaenia lowii]
MATLMAVILGTSAATHMILTAEQQQYQHLDVGSTGSGSIVLSDVVGSTAHVEGYDAVELTVKKFFLDRDRLHLPASGGAIFDNSAAHPAGGNGTSEAAEAADHDGG